MLWHWIAILLFIVAPWYLKMSSSSLIKLAVGSKNPVKVNAALVGAQKALSGGEVSVFGYDVPSGISEQPKTDLETLQGAINRAKNAYNAYEAEHGKGPDFSIGLEGGVAPSIFCNEDLECYAWMVVYNGTQFGRARTGSFLLPPAITQLIAQGMELGAADDKIFGTSNSKQKGGSVGQLTLGVIDRTSYYEHAVVLAFVPFLWPDLYSD
jgi:inosine/xanthosine triphosphatase